MGGPRITQFYLLCPRGGSGSNGGKEGIRRVPEKGLV
jgi:hypothetical protein